LPRRNGFHRSSRRPRDVRSGFGEFYGQIAALPAAAVDQFKFMLICCNRATEILVRRQHQKERKRARPASLSFGVDGRPEKPPYQ
jgi:hypothetical protein